MQLRHWRRHQLESHVRKTACKSRCSTSTKCSLSTSSYEVAGADGPAPSLGKVSACLAKATHNLPNLLSRTGDLTCRAQVHSHHKPPVMKTKFTRPCRLRISRSFYMLAGWLVGNRWLEIREPVCVFEEHIKLACALQCRMHVSPRFNLVRFVFGITCLALNLWLQLMRLGRNAGRAAQIEQALRLYPKDPKDPKDPKFRGLNPLNGGGPYESTREVVNPGFLCCQAEY